MRSCGGEPTVTCRSDAPLSTIVFSSWCSVIACAGGGCAACGFAGDEGDATDMLFSFSLFRRLSSFVRSVGGGDAGDLVGRRGPLADLGDARHAQRAHAAPDRLRL